MVISNSSNTPFAKSKKIRVLIVDDSVLMCAMIRAALQEDQDIEVVDSASDPYDAREKIKLLNPDIMTLDIQMPKMDGLSFLERVMTLRPMPVVMLSSLTEKGAQETLHALERGAVDYHCKPDKKTSLEKWAAELREKIKVAAHARVRPLKIIDKKNENLIRPPLSVAKARSDYIIAIGASTGGVEALYEIVPLLPRNCSPVLIVQHMPERFTKSFANRLNKQSHVEVIEAQNGMLLRPEMVYIAPGNQHLSLACSPSGYITAVHDGDFVNGHKPSVDVLFHSCAKIIPKKTVAALLTGMGKDGAEGLKALHDRGGFTIGQSKETCVVYGMPRAAKLFGALIKEVPLNQIAISLLQNSG
ncbi:MAG: chemotaxis response regulator protein-glutamate methylesterase [Proteobacteria bacterium]|nr:chemotaxis response regulator protein-glutamate methylesterase [Pseudomonadota bacterium]